ncbi:MAG: M23 family metallopeptidase [Bacteroidota bacterium]|jgi:hypothetical protein
MNRLLFLFLCLNFIPTSYLKSQNKYPQNYFRSPVDFRIVLSGTFGELRPDHFHTGIDIKTQGKEGAPIYAVADAYVSRIKISPYGYGNSIYLTHPNGYVSVYAHLSKINSKLAAYVKEHQYKRKSFDVDLYLDKDQFVFKKGEVIAFSGNSGGSGGPHLHFEIRDEKTQEPINPLLFGFEVKDFIRPVIQSLRVYPLGKTPFNLEIGGWGEKHYLKAGDTLALPKAFYLGISTLDKQNDSENSNGVFEVELIQDSVKIFGNRQEKLDFAKGKFINTFIDYEYYSKTKKRYQRTYISPYNQLEIYTGVKNKGLINLKENKVSEFVYSVKDANGNVSKLKFYAKSGTSNLIKQFPLDTLKKAVLVPGREHFFVNDNIKITIPANALYDSLNFHFQVLPKLKNSYTEVYQVHNPDVPLHNSIELKIKSDNIPLNLKDKLVIASISGNAYNAYSTEWNGEWASSFISGFGNYTIVADTIKPEITFMGTSTNGKLDTNSIIRIKIEDKLSGIKSYNGYFNNEWVVFEYDAKNNMVYHYIEPQRLKTENILRFEVIDKVGNKNSIERKLNRI